MSKISLPICFEDERGQIIDLVTDKQINAATVVTFTPGAVRGNHYHKVTTQWDYVMSGKLRQLTKKPEQEIEETILEPGDLYETVPGEWHALEALEPSTLLVLTQGPRGGKEYESDTYRLDPPLITPNT